METSICRNIKLRLQRRHLQRGRHRVWRRRLRFLTGGHLRKRVEKWDVFSFPGKNIGTSSINNMFSSGKWPFYGKMKLNWDTSGSNWNRWEDLMRIHVTINTLFLKATIRIQPTGFCFYFRKNIKTQKHGENYRQFTGIWGLLTYTYGTKYGHFSSSQT